MRPLVAGGTIKIGRPITLSELDDFENDLAHASVELVSVDDARASVLVDLVVNPPPLVLERDELNLAAALHNMLFMAHPSVDGFLVTSNAKNRVLQSARILASQPLTTNRRRVLARHALLHNVFDVSRLDVKLSWWTGSAQFYGQTPPSRLVKWRSVRRVNEETSTATYDQLLASDDIAPLMATLLRRSPLTQLLHLPLQAPALHWEDAVFVLRDPELCRAVAYHATQPTEADKLFATPARFAASFEQMIERSPRLDDIRAVSAFLVYLNALIALSEVRMRDRAAKSPLLTTILARDRAGHWPRGLDTFLALPNALAHIDPRMAEPPGLNDEPQLYQRWRVHREQVAAGVGETVIINLVRRLHRAVHPAMPIPTVLLDESAPDTNSASDSASSALEAAPPAAPTEDVLG